MFLYVKGGINNLNKINPESVEMMVKYAIIMVGILLLIFLIAIITPKIGNLIDKARGKKQPQNLSEENSLENDPISTDPREMEIKGIYDPQPPSAEEAPTYIDENKE